MADETRAIPRAAPARWTRAFWILIALLSAAIALYSYRYLLSIGPLATGVLENAFARPWLDMHVAGAATALLVGPFQFLAWTRRSALHRTLGKIYVVACLLGGVAGFVLALGSTAGPPASLGFGLLAIAWLTTTLLAWRAARQRRFDSHRAWMIRSFALTFAAVTLRLYLPALPLLPISFLDGYRVISFACWIPNLLVAQIYVAAARNRAANVIVADS